MESLKYQVFLWVHLLFHVNVMWMLKCCAEITLTRQWARHPCPPPDCAVRPPRPPLDGSSSTNARNTHTAVSASPPAASPEHVQSSETPAPMWSDSLSNPRCYSVPWHAPWCRKYWTRNVQGWWCGNVAYPGVCLWARSVGMSGQWSPSAAECQARCHPGADGLWRWACNPRQI